VTERRLPVRSCRVIGDGDLLETDHTVACPRRQLSTSFARCCGCAHMRSIDVAEDGTSGTVECSVVEEAEPHGKVDKVDVAEAAIRMRLGDLIGTETTCVRNDLRIGAVTDLLATSKLRALPVVDAERRLVGIVSKSDLLRLGRGQARKTVGNIMTPLVHGLPEDAPVAYAISLMAFEGLHEVPVVDKSARVVGMITSTDALRWVAKALGYVAQDGQTP
jgi:CBS domain-containing protein